MCNYVYRWELRCPGLLRREKWYFITDVSGQSIGPWTLRIGPIGSPETSVRNYHYSPRNNPEDHSSLLLRSEIQKSRSVYKCFF